MFEKIHAQQQFRKSGTAISEIAARDMKGYTETLDAVRLGGGLSPSDPRRHLDPVEIRKLSELRNDQLLARYGALAAEAFNNPKDRDARIAGAAMLRAQRAEMQKASSSTSSQAIIAERSALALAKADPGNKAAREMLAISAALSDRGQRERVMQGFETRDGVGNIAKAAKAQGRSWLEVRDELVKFDVLKKDDPRRRVRKADIDFQKGGALSVSKVVQAEELESSAMSALKKNPKDEQAYGWLATTGAMQGDKQAKKVKGTLPPRKTLFGKIGDLEL